MTQPVPVIQGETVLFQRIEADGIGSVLTQLEELAALYMKGMKRLVLVRTTMRSPEIMAMSKEAVEQFDRLLVSRGLEPMVVKQVGPTSKAAAVLHAQAEEIATTARRRQLLSQIAPDAEKDDVPPALTELQTFGANQAGALFAVAPVIDPNVCTGCHACHRACPADVLIYINDNSSGGRYTVSPAGCDACGLCVDLCTPSAIGLAFMTQRPDDIALTNWTCTACGVQVHAPVANAATDGLCDICRRTGHHKKLFQVLS